MPIAVQRSCGCVMGVAYPKPIVQHKMAYDRAKHELMLAREAMGFPRAAGRKRPFSDGQRQADVRTLLLRASGAASQDATTQHREGQGAPSNPPQQQAQHLAELEGVPLSNEARLCALGFPPEAAKAALSAFPDDLNRAADWLLQAEHW